VDESAEAPRRFFKRRYLVDRRFQVKYTLIIVALSSVIYLILGYHLYKGELARTEILNIQNRDLQMLVASQDSSILYYLVGFFLLQAASLVILGILITHRIAGPVYRVQKYLEDVAQGGELKPLDKVRSRDEFHEFFDALSAVIERFRK
jgi:methyl-accepting chemotaxis protein